MNKHSINPSSTTEWGPPTPEENVRALLRELVFDCVSGDMRAGMSAVWYRRTLVGRPINSHATSPCTFAR